MSFLPPQWDAYSPIVMVILLFVDGLIFGVAIKRAVMSVVLIVVALLVAGFIGLSIPFLSVSDITTHITNILVSQSRHIGSIVYGFPIFWLIGLAIGIWQG